MNQYELTFILGEKAHQEEGEKKTAEISKQIEKFGGKVTKQELWGRRELAYIIKRNRTGFYATLWFDLEPELVKPLEELLRFDEEVIRSLVTKAYVDAQPGSLYPVVEEDDKKSKKDEVASSAEEMIRRSPSKTAKTSKKEEDNVEEVSDEERLKKIDESLEELLKDEE